MNITQQVPRIGFRTEKVNGQNLYGMGNIAYQTARLLSQREDMLLFTIRRSTNSHALYSETHSIVIPSFPPKIWSRLAPAFVRLWGLDLLHYPDHKVFPLYCKPAKKVIVTIHGLMPLQVPNELIYKPLDKRTLFLLRNAEKYVDAIATVSEFSKRSIMREFGLRDSFIHVIPNGIDENIFCDDVKGNDNILVKRGISTPYLFHVSNLKKVKNFETVIEVFIRLASSNPKLSLVVAGGLPDTLSYYQQLARETSYSDRIHFLGVVTGKSLATLYRGALLLLFPSYYESFGLPVLEAMACGCPVIASDIPSFSEFTGGSVLFFPPVDAEAMATVAQHLHDHSDYRNTLSKIGIKISMKYTWSAVAGQYAKLYFDVLGLSVY